MGQKMDTAEFKTKVFDYEKNSEWKFEGEIPCIVDFYADWCPPCKMMDPILDQLSREYQGKLNVYRVNTDEEVDLAAVFGVQSIPTLLFVPLTGEPRVSVGALPRPQILTHVKEFLQVD